MSPSEDGLARLWGQIPARVEQALREAAHAPALPRLERPAARPSPSPAFQPRPAPVGRAPTPVLKPTAVRRGASPASRLRPWARVTTAGVVAASTAFVALALWINSRTLPLPPAPAAAQVPTLPPPPPSILTAPAPAPVAIAPQTIDAVADATARTSDASDVAAADARPPSSEAVRPQPDTKAAPLPTFVIAAASASFRFYVTIDGKESGPDTRFALPAPASGEIAIRAPEVFLPRTVRAVTPGAEIVLDEPSTIDLAVTRGQCSVSINEYPAIALPTRSPVRILPGEQTFGFACAALQRAWVSRRVVEKGYTRLVEVTK
jgi:hypothetical protein